MIEHGYLTDKPHPSFSHHSAQPSSSSPSSSLQPSSLSLLASSWWKARTVADLKLETPLTVTPAVTCQQCVDILNKQGYDQLPCVSNDNQILGSDSSTLSFSTSICRRSLAAVLLLTCPFVCPHCAGVDGRQNGHSRQPHFAAALLTRTAG